MNMSINIDEFDFCDFGCRNGGSIQYGIKHLKGKRGFGIDIDPKCVEVCQTNGYDAMVGDFCNINLPDKCVDFSLLFHVLEHLPTLNQAQAAIKNAIKISKKFVFIMGPYFDADDYLKSLGLKMYWSDWTGHPLHLTTDNLISILDELKVENYEIYKRSKLTTSSSEEFIPFNAPINSLQYDLIKHGEKPIVEFNQLLFREIMCIIWLSDTISNVDDIRRSRDDRYLIQKKGTFFPIPL